jgi:amino acid transporter
MWNTLKQMLIGSPLPTEELSERRLNNLRALAAFSPDALSSIAYANQEIFLGLVVAGSAGLVLSWPIGLAITGLLVLVAISYFQTIQGYPSGGGSYLVARDNLGLFPGLLAGAALLIGYLLTAAVSLTAGVAEIASAFPALWPYRVPLALFLLGIITLINLRGVRESGTMMAVPVYLFLACYLSMLAFGLIRALKEGPGSLQATAPPATQALTLALVLRTFSSGCTALTGIEAISNGVPAFRPPEAKNAGLTLIAMAVLMGTLFIGSIGLTRYLGVVAGPEETILSALSRRLLGGGPAYVAVQATTLLILVVATNTSFAGFPRLVAVLARDGFLPRQLTALGDRLVYNNGIFLLALAAGGLMVAFQGNTHALIPLFAVGVFLAFTLSQAGMVVHWWKDPQGSWWLKAGINSLGAVVTGVTTLVVGFSNFTRGAWITILLLPVLVAFFIQIQKHYQETAEQLALTSSPTPIHPIQPLRLVIPVSGIHRGIVDAIDFARSISSRVTGLYVELEAGAGDRIRTEWERRWPEIPLVVVPSPYRSIIGPLLDYLDQTDASEDDGQLAAVVLPEYIPAKWWQGLLHNQTAWLIKVALLYRRRHQGFQRLIIDVPYHLQK